MPDSILPIDVTAPTPAGSPGPSEARYRFEVLEGIGQQWDSMVATFADACLEQMAAHAVTRWGSSRVCGLVLRDLATSEPLALALVVLATIPLIKYGLAYVKFGPLWRRQGRRADPAVLMAALEAVKHAFPLERGLVARVMPPPDPGFEAEWTKAMAAAGFTLVAPAPDPDRYLVDLQLTESEQLASLASRWRANLNKARTSALDIREVDPKASLPDFLALYQGMLARKQFADHHHIDVLPAFTAAALPGLGVRLFLAYHQGRAVAGSMLVGAGERIFVAYSASSEMALTLRAGYAMRWWIINRLRGSGAHWLDLGGAEGDPGLRSFKLGNVGKRGRVAQIPGEYDFAGNAFSNLVSAAMTSTRRLMQGGAVQAQPLKRA